MVVLNFRALKTLSLFSLSIILTGCVWSNYKVPPQSIAVFGTSPGPVVTLQNLDDSALKTNALAAVKLASQVVNHQDFIQGLQGKNLRASCSSDKLVKGEEVYESLNEAHQFSLVAKKPWFAIAVADISKRRVAIRKSRFRKWNGTVEQRGELIETLVHEMTHMIPEITSAQNKKTIQSRYKDDGHGTASCPDLDLVSYHVGDLAKRVYISNHQNFNF